MKKFVYIFLFFFKAIAFFSQLSADSTGYKTLITEYEAVINVNRLQAKTIAQQIEKKSLAQKNNFFLSDALIKLAVVYYFENNYDSARYFIKKSIPFAKQSGNYKIEMRGYNLLGAIYYNQGNFKNAEKYYLEKIKIAQKSNDTTAIYGTYYNIGLVFFQQGNYLKSADYNFKALDFFERNKDTFNVISSLQSIGFTYMNLDDVPSSIKFYTRALTLAKGYRDKYQLAGIYIDISTAQDALLHKDSSLYYLDLALKLSSKEKDDFHFNVALNNKASHYLEGKNYGQALLLAKEAEKLNLKTDRQLALCEVYNTMSKAYYHLNLTDSALKYAKKAYGYGVVQQQSKMIQECTKTLSFIYELRKNSDSALKYYKLYFAFNDTLKKESQLRGIAQKEFLFEKHNQEEYRAKEKLLAETRLDKQKQINLIVIIASILLALFLLIGIINFRQKQKANALVVLQKKMLEDKQKEILDSINYASRIQQSLMPTEKYIHKNLLKIKPK